MIQIKNIVLSVGLLSAIQVCGQNNYSTDNSTIYTATATQSTPIYTATSEEKPLSPKEYLDVTLTSMASDPVLRNAQWGFAVYDPKSQKLISAYNEKTPLIPASTTKLLTTETAMSLLGSNFQWLTQLEYSGEIDENGVLNGNLYLIGSGDPSLGTNKAGATSYGMISMDFIAAMAEKGIKRVNGNIVVQTAVFKTNKIPTLPENIVWLENGSYYLPMGSTREIDPSKEKIIVKQSNPFQQEKRYFYVSPYIKKMVFAEEYQPIDLASKLPDPPVSLANSLKTAMLKSGIPIIGKVLSKTIDTEPEKRMLISTYRSPDLNDIVFYTNQHSDNALAEATLRMVGFQKLGDQTLESGRKVVVEHLVKKDFDTEGLNFMDGSGLSRANMVTPLAQVKFLTSLMNEKYFKNYFDSLPIGGQTGTLKRMFVYGNGNGQIFAKTGTLNKVKCLAGYVKTKSGKLMAFSLLVNNYSGSTDMVKRKMEMLLEPVLEL
ncbi:MAG: D-alanyl-D-alanine carboxypeptidase/D-alanyl-D-alanine-endopeptidase [Bacteroidetes bacterium]|nr:D-alanyl-D-alanine carboxypeptidase/D-alanyl-D-alanine-endopeptidase [Bacteroidota bacterium]